MATSVQKALVCTKQLPVSLVVGDNTNFITGQKIISITFPHLVISGIDEIHFQNYYTALLTIKAKFQCSNEDSQVWKTCLKRYPLMPVPHCGIGSENNFVISRKQFNRELTNVLALKLILLQPSPVWIDFSLENIEMFCKSYMYTNEEMSDNKGEHNCENDVENEDGVNHMKCSPLQSNPCGMALSEISETMKVWSAVDQPISGRPKVKQTKYENDGTYDIKVLSYS
ncbi:nicolin-1-like [Argonauta hians]